MLCSKQEDIWIQKCVLVSVFANAFEFAKLRLIINFCYTVDKHYDDIILTELLKIMFAAGTNYLKYAYVMKQTTGQRQDPVGNIHPLYVMIMVQFKSILEL